MGRAGREPERGLENVRKKSKKTAQSVNGIILCYVYKGITSFQNVAKRSKSSQVREVGRGAGAPVGGEKTQGIRRVHKVEA